MSDEHDLKPMGDATDLAAKVPDAPSAVEPKVDLIADLPEKEIRDRLRLVNPALVDEIYELAKAQVESERARHIMLNSKAASILTASGVSLTLSLTLAGPLLAGKVVLPTLLSCGFALAGLLGLAAVLSAVLSLFVVGGFAYVSDHAVFDKKILDFADSPTGCEDLPDPSDKYAFGAAAYRQHMTAHLWAVSAKEHRQLDKKANQVRAAQWLFTLFAVLISTCGASLFWVISSQNKDAREAAAAESAAEGEVRRQRAASAAAAQVVPNAGQATQASAASAARSTANSGPRSSPHSGGANAAGGATF
jgi:hypothetical protein